MVDEASAEGRENGIDGSLGLVSPGHAGRVQFAQQAGVIVGLQGTLQHKNERDQ